MKTFKRLCIKNYKISDNLGNCFELQFGKRYITSDIKNNKVIVFSNFWVTVPIKYFSFSDVSSI